MCSNLFRVSMVMVIGFALAGCSDLNRENYDKINLGMDKTEVEEIIGSASTCKEIMGTESCVWGEDDGKHIKIKFIAEKSIIITESGLE